MYILCTFVVRLWPGVVYWPHGLTVSHSGANHNKVIVYAACTIVFHLQSTACSSETVSLLFTVTILCGISPARPIAKVPLILTATIVL